MIRESTCMVLFSSTTEQFAAADLWTVVLQLYEVLPLFSH